MPSVVVACALAALAVGALVLGPLAFAVLVLAVAVAVLVDLSLLLAAAGARPVLPVALVPGLVLPAMVAGDVAVDPGAGWDRLPGAYAAALLGAFVLVLVFGRRGGAVAGLGSTAIAALLVGLGASGLILLRGLPSGTTWVLVVVGLVVAADGAGPLARAVLSRRASDDVLLPPGLPQVAPALVAVAVVVGLLAALLDAPFEPVVLAGLGLVAVVAALGGAELHRVLVAEAGVGGGDGRVGEGLLLGVVDATAIAAPAAYVLARAVAL
jgi:hypothetical protein